MFCVTTCPKCSRQVAVPVSADPFAQVRCPLCHAEYPIQEALHNAPPELEIISSSADSDVGEAEPEFVPRSAPKSSDEERGTTRMMIEVIVGGLLAGPIAIAILMWGLGKDPLHLAKKLPQVLVPPSLRGEPAEEPPPVAPLRPIRR